MTAGADLAGGHSWSSLVTAALLGTDRCPLEAQADQPPDPAQAARATDPVTVLLDLAAVQRTALQAGSPLSTCPAPDPAPAARLPAPPAAARVLLSELLARPEPALVNAWLAACVAAGLGAPAEHWPRLAELAARSRDYDRSLLRRALGPRGLWFLAQHPRWVRLAEDPGQRPDDPDDPEDSALQWQEALDLVTSGRLGAETPQIAQVVAVAVPLSDGRALLERLDAAEEVSADLDLGAPPASRRLVQRALRLIRRTITARLEIEACFGPGPGQRSPTAQPIAEAAP